MLILTIGRAIDMGGEDMWIVKVSKSAKKIHNGAFVFAKEVLHVALAIAPPCIMAGSACFANTSHRFWIVF